MNEEIKTDYFIRYQEDDGVEINGPTLVSIEEARKGIQDSVKKGNKGFHQIIERTIIESVVE